MNYPFIFSIVASILLFAGSNLNQNNLINNILRKSLQPITTPISHLQNNFNSNIKDIRSIPNLKKESKDLKNENDLLKIKVKALTDLVKDQQAKEKLSNLDWPTIPLKYVNQDKYANFTTTSSFDQIKEGQPIVSNHSLIGIIKSVDAPIIRVITLNNPEIRLSVQLENSVKGQLVVEDKIPTITNLPSDTSYHSRTTVFTLPTDKIPENIIIGQVNQITTNLSSPFQKVTVDLNETIATSNSFAVVVLP